jgi:hypothetical protein
MSKNSEQHRRSVLDSLKSGVENPPGPLIDGLRESDELVVASFRSPYVCQRFLRALSSAGVNSTTKKEGGKTTVTVRFADREAAWEILAQQRSNYPDQPPKRTRGAYDFTIFGALLGTMFGMASITLTPRFFILALMCLGGIGTGIVVGYLADRFHRSYRYLGRLQFDITDCLVLTAATSLLVSFWTYVARLF